MPRGQTCAVLLAALALCATAGAQSGVVLDETSYWRYWLQGGPMRIRYEAMKTDANDLFSGRELDHHKRTVLKQLKDAGVQTDDWRKEILYPAGYLNLRLLNEVETSPPPADWAQADFDDRDWSCYRKPFKMGKDFYLDGFVDHFYQIRNTFFRGTFDVPDPAAAGDLQLDLVYRGGVRVLLNGREIARGHLPPGPLASSTDAEPYPFEAYYAKPGEHPGLTGRDTAAWQVAGERFLVPDLCVFARLPVEYDQLETSDKVPAAFRRVRAIGYAGSCYLTRAGWDRVVRLRNRTLRVTLPAGQLRKGANVLALEVRTSPLHPTALRWAIPWQGSCAWKHGWLMGVRLTGPVEAVPPTTARPRGTQVWAVDVHHRLYSREFQPPGEMPPRLRTVGGRNGTCSAQLAVGTDRPLKGLKAAVSDFQGPGGRKLPASVARVLYHVAHPEWELRTIGEGKSSGEETRPGPTRGNALVVLDRLSALPDIIGPVDSDGAAGKQRESQERELKDIRFFDHLSAAPIETVPAGTCQPVWISLSVPADARAGAYSSTVRVEAEGMQSVSLPLELIVADWRVPDPREFQTILCLEQSPYAVARHYQVEPWSPEHFRLMEKSLDLLGQVGNDFLAIPVLCRTEFGNSADSPLRVRRRKDGSLSLDFTLVDRYLDAATRHWGRPWCVVFVVDHCGRVDYGQTLQITDEATGRKELLSIGPGADESLRRSVWRALAGGIDAHMKSRGLGGSLYWGLHGDQVNDSSLPRLLAEFAPGVTWARFSHQYHPDETYTLCANVRGGHFLATTSRGGWKARSVPVNLWIPRHWNSIATCEGKSAPFAWRLGIERTLSAGAPGAARIGADYWDATWLHDFPLRPYTGMPILSVLWPGPDGAEPSVRFQMLREGLQETEARIFLEQAVAKLNDPALAKAVTALLDRRIHDTLFAIVSAPHVKIEEYGSGWQVRSRALYEMAAAVAGRLGVDLDRGRLAADIPARGAARVEVNLRNWTSAPRAWKLATDQEWIRPAGTEGQAEPGSRAIIVTLDAARLAPGQQARGALTLTDLATGRTERLEVAATVSDVMSFAGPETVVNVPCGGRDVLAFTLLNHSAGELDWTLEAGHPWAKAEPARGRLAAGAMCPVRVALAPPDPSRARREVPLRIREAGGAELTRDLVVHVLPPPTQLAARPAGQAVPMQQLTKALLASFVEDGRRREIKNGLPFHEPQPNRPLTVGRKAPNDYHSSLKEYKAGLSLQPGSEVVLNVKGKALAAFWAEVGWSSQSRVNPETRQAVRLHFELYVDGRLAAHSGLMDITDPPRLLAAEGLQDASELRLVTRMHNDKLNDKETRVYGVWGDPAFHERP